MKAPLDDVSLHYEDIGDPQAPALVFAHTLGTSADIWDAVIARLPRGLRVIRYDLRGHGQSDVPPAPYSMGSMVRDAERLLDFLSVQDAVFCGLGLGGMIAQGLAVKRLDQVRALVLCNTAVKIGHGPHWDNRIALAGRSGLSYLAQEIVPMWFAAYAAKSAQAMATKDHFLRSDPQGVIGAMAAIRGTDFYTPTSGLRLQTLGISGADDRMVPPDLSRETCDLIPGSEFQVIRRAGHLACVDQPEIFAEHLNGFLKRIAHT